MGRCGRARRGTAPAGRDQRDGRLDRTVAAALTVATLRGVELGLDLALVGDEHAAIGEPDRAPRDRGDR